jgi:hypothetical protein
VPPHFTAAPQRPRSSCTARACQAVIAACDRTQDDLGRPSNFDAGERYVAIVKGVQRRRRPGEEAWDLVRGRRAGEEEALALVDAETPQHGELRGRLDALGAHLHAHGAARRRRGGPRRLPPGGTSHQHRSFSAPGWGHPLDGVGTFGG